MLSVVILHQQCRCEIILPPKTDSITKKLNSMTEKLVLKYRKTSRGVPKYELTDKRGRSNQFWPG